MGSLAPGLGQTSSHKDQIRVSVLVGEMTSVVALSGVSQGNVCSVLQWLHSRERGTSLSFRGAGNRYLQSLKPGWQTPDLLLQPCRDWNLFVALRGFLFGSLGLSLCFSCFLKSPELFEILLISCL